MDKQLRVMSGAGRELYSLMRENRAGITGMSDRSQMSTLERRLKQLTHSVKVVAAECGRQRRISANPTTRSARGPKWSSKKLMQFAVRHEFSGGLIQHDWLQLAVMLARK
jgi:hypothetical protein